MSKVGRGNSFKNNHIGLSERPRLYFAFSADPVFDVGSNIEKPCGVDVLLEFEGVRLAEQHRKIQEVVGGVVFPGAIIKGDSPTAAGVTKLRGHSEIVL